MALISASSFAKSLLLKLAVFRFAMPKGRRIWFEVITLGGGQALTVAGTIVGTRVLTELLPPAEYGELALALTIASGLNLLGSGPIGNAVGRFFALAQEKEKLRCFYRVVAGLFAQRHLGTCAVALVCLLAYGAKSENKEMMLLGLTAVVLSLLNGAGGVLDSMQNAARQRLVVAWHQAAGQWARIIASILFVRWFGASATMALCGYVAASLLALGSQAMFFRTRLLRVSITEYPTDVTYPALLADEMRAYANPFIAFSGVAWLQQSSDRWLLALLGSRATVGLYQTLTQLGYSPFVQLSSLVSVVVGPILFARAGDGTDTARMNRARRDILQLSVFLFAVTLAGAWFLLVFHRPIAMLFVAKQYCSMSGYLPIAALAGGLFAFGQMLCTDAMMRINTKALMAPKIGTAILAVVLNWLGAWRFGLPGVVWAGVITSTVYAGWMLKIATFKYSSREEHELVRQ